MHPFFIEKELILIVDNRFAANNNKNKGNQNKDLVNENIRFPEVLLIGPNGEQLGVMSSREAQFKANDYDLDLLLNFSKSSYQEFAIAGRFVTIRTFCACTVLQKS